MNQVKRGLVFFMAVIMSLCSLSMNAYADDSATIMPLYDYTSNASSSLGFSNGRAVAGVYCMGYAGTTTKITAKTCIQKKFGLIWIKVDIGTSDDYWYDSTTNYYLSKEHSVTLSGSGTYRAKTEYVVTGSNGKSETITVHSSEREY